jgi:probable F420-dependent oxidoreductase
MVRAMRPFRFGVQVSRPPRNTTWPAFARHLESLGYSTMTMPDHFDKQLAPLPALALATAATERLRVGALVWANDYKHPVVMAKELATIDVLSDGRLEIGLGAGWMASDYAAAGLPYESPGTRIERLIEAVAVMNGLFADEPLSFAGRHYQVTHDGWPKPVQRPRPPLLLGGGGRRMLTVAAQLADIVGVNATLTNGVIDAAAIATMSAAAVDEKVGWVQAAAAGREIELNVRTFLVEITDDRAGAAQRMAELTGFTADEVLESPFALIGTPSQLVDDLRARRERWGFSYVIVGPAEADAFAPVVAELAGM